MIALKTMLKNKKMNSNIIANFFKRFYFTFSDNFSFTNLKALLNLLNKTRILILYITLFKNNCSYFVCLRFGFIYTCQWSLTVFGITTICPITDFRISSCILGYCLRVLCWMKRVTLSRPIRILC